MSLHSLIRYYGLHGRESPCSRNLNIFFWLSRSNAAHRIQYVNIHILYEYHRFKSYSPYSSISYVLKLDGDDNGLIYWLGTRGHSQPFRSPMSFGQLDVQSSGVHIGSCSCSSRYSFSLSWFLIHLPLLAIAEFTTFTVLFVGSHYGNENALVSRSAEEVRLINTPSCWFCVDVGRSRAISPTHLCVVHGRAQQVESSCCWML